jgi:uncharacterized phage-associated protein
MKFVLNRRKAAQAAALLLHWNGGKMDLLLLLKLLYLADRMALQKSGFPITGDKMVSMEWGPVLSDIYDATKKKKKQRAGDPWFDYVSERHNHMLSAVKANPETDELSKSELSILKEVYAEFGDKDPFAVSDWTHNFPEYTDPNGSSLPIDPTIILREAGRTEDEIREISQLCEEVAFLKRRKSD